MMTVTIGLDEERTARKLSKAIAVLVVRSNTRPFVINADERHYKANFSRSKTPE